MPDLDFPNNVVELFKDNLSAISPEHFAVGRPLRPTDPQRSFGVFATIWTPRVFEIGQLEPAIGSYNLVVQSMVKVATEEEGVQEHASLAKKVRALLYRNVAFRVELGQLNTLSEGMLERVQRFGITQQRYLSNEVSGSFLFLSVTESYVETELTPAE